MPEKRKFICTGTVKDKQGKILPCNRIIAEIEYANDVRIEIKCGKCGTMNTIQARPKVKTEREIVKKELASLGTFPIQKISV